MRGSSVSAALLFFAGATVALLAQGPYPPAAGQPGSTAIWHGDPRIVGWGAGSVDVERGYANITNPDDGFAANGEPGYVLGQADALGDPFNTLSLGDGGSVTLSFAQAIVDGPGFDFAVFENGLTDGRNGATFLELAFVEVSADGVNFRRFPSVSLTPTQFQVPGGGTLDARDLHNLAGKYVAGYGTPFDLADFASIDPPLIQNVHYIRIIDVVGKISGPEARFDSLGNPINDPWSTPYETGGFDLDAVAILAHVPEPGFAGLLTGGLAVLFGRRSRRN